MQHHRFLGSLDRDHPSEPAALVPTVGGFVVCPLACVPGLALPAPPWQQLYQLAFEQAQQMHRRRLELERYQHPCWN